MEQVIDLKPKKKTFWKKQAENFKKNSSIIWFILPAAALVLFFGYLPMFGIIFAFKTDLDSTNWIYDIFKQGWTFEHLLGLFKNSDVLLALGNTLMISITRLIICFPASILFAILLSEIKKPWVSKLILIVMCLPNFLSWPVTIGIWNNLLSEFGLVNNFLSAIGQERVLFLQQDEYFKFFVITLSIWKGLGWGSIYFYAAIMSIDKEYYEAATIDGASKIQKIWYLTIPGILPVIALQLVLNITYIMDAGFDQVYAMLQLSRDLTETQQILGTYTFDLYMRQGEIPLSVAISVVNGIFSLVLMLVGNWFVKKKLGSSLW